MKTKRKTSKIRLKNKRKVNTETDFLLSTKANAARLSESISQDKLGKTIALKT
jgi:PHD/YefM family antitoxin component YafN of YafNO toxin-antitoxin module